MKVFSALILWGTLISATGCANFIAVQDQAREKAAAAADIELDHAVWALCKAPTRGALVRRYTVAEQMQQHDAFCRMEAARDVDVGLSSE